MLKCWSAIIYARFGILNIVISPAEMKPCKKKSVFELTHCQNVSPRGQHEESQPKAKNCSIRSFDENNMWSQLDTMKSVRDDIQTEFVIQASWSSLNLWFQSLLSQETSLIRSVYFLRFHLWGPYRGPPYAQSLILVNLILVNFFGCLVIARHYEGVKRCY